MQRLAATSAAAALALATCVARAQQVDVNPPLPNVLLLIDNSGSMERMIDGSLPESDPTNACNCNAGDGTCDFNRHPPPNRWGVMLQAMTGSLTNGYNCAAMPRAAGSTFTNEYAIASVNPYDTDYYIPFHRPIAQDSSNPLAPLSCVYAPGALPGATTPNGVGPQGLGAGGKATEFPTGAIVQHTYGTTNPKTCVFGQNLDGALDSELDLMRFGLMTFDQDPSASTGVTSSNAVDTPAFAGMWSYFPGWNTGGACPYLGNPANCATQSVLAVGARNPAAPPWEGRMVPFPATTDTATQETQNANIQQVLLASRPYGATPLAGMFVGAQYYLQTDPAGPQQTDTYVKGGCRSEYIILLTDGAPNLDLRPSCEGMGSPNGVCPFPPPDTTAQALFTPGSVAKPVTTYVIGFAVSSFQDQGSTVYCSSLVNNGQLSSVCNDPTKQSTYGACCQLQKIALAGGTNQAFFADTPGDLQIAVGTILAQIAKNTTTRTTPAFSVVSNVLADPTAPQTNAALFLASFNPTPGRPWSGDLQRQRYQCSLSGGGGSSGGGDAGSGSGGGGSAGYSVIAPGVQTTAGDDFAANLNTAGSKRTVVVLMPDVPNGGSPDATATIRPYAASSGGDGVGRYSATTYVADPTVISNIKPEALNLTGTSCQYNPTGGGATKNLTATQCRDMLFDFALAQSFGSNPGDFPFVSRVGNAFGDVFHATPAVVGPPSSLSRDDSYIGFRATYAKREQIVYAATNDGLLHAFWADETKLENNERWALMPPAVMPSLLKSYPANHLFLLDGPPIVKDVVWDRPLANHGDATTWHTMLVAGFGPAQAGYYAIDVTNPNVTGASNGAVPTDPPPKGPVFRWQLTKMPGTNAQLFGAKSATPAITSVFVDPGDGGGAREIGVAILPGGQDSGPATTGGSVAQCGRATKATEASPRNAYLRRDSVRCWGTPPVGQTPSTNDPVVGRSLSVVRLDTGEILRVFIRQADVPSTDTVLAAKRITDTALDSPMVGTPMVYPSDVGSDATRVFVGDADGTIWRFDLSNPDPTKWVGELFLDLYNVDVDKNPTNAWADGQPVQLPLVTSLDNAGNVVVHAATGSQDTIDSSGLFYVYSITEKLDDKLRASVNWWVNPAGCTSSSCAAASLPSVAGERVSGPMTVFDGVLYFATYASAPAGSQSCTSGDARLWGLDFVNPADTNALYKGGVPRLQAPAGQTPLNPLPTFIQPDLYDSTLSGVVIPGVAIRATPACAGLGTSGSDSYVAGANHQQTQNFTTQQTQYSLFTQVGAKGAGGASTRQYEVQLPTPVSPTTVDSWAGVLQ